MRHKYATTGIVLSRTSIGEASAFITLLTPDLGLIRGRAQSIRKPGAKLAPALQTLVESDVILVKGKDGWRLSGAVLVKDWFTELQTPEVRLRAGRTAGLLLRLVHGESLDPIFFALFSAFLTTLVESDQATQDAAECLAVLRFLHALGFDAGEVPGGVSDTFAPAYIEEIEARRAEYILRINKGIAASGV
jgi:DNA repair protein RecO